MAISSPKAIESIEANSMTCPTNILNTQYARCNISWIFGTDVTAQVTYGDGNSETYVATGNTILFVIDLI